MQVSSKHKKSLRIKQGNHITGTFLTTERLMKRTHIQKSVINFNSCPYTVIHHTIFLVA